MKWYFKVLRSYFTFSGRARRKEYWMFALFNAIVSVALIFLDIFFGTMNLDLGIGIISGIYSLLVLFPSIAVALRRLHDTNRSGWWLLLILLPLIGPIVLIVFFCQAGNVGINEYGSDPKIELY